jgi:integrase
MSNQSSTARARSPIAESDHIVRPFTIVPKAAPKKKLTLNKGYYLRGRVVWVRKTKLRLNESTGFGIDRLDDAYRRGEELILAARHGELGWAVQSMPTVRQYFDAEPRTKYDRILLPFVKAHATDRLDAITEKTCRAWITLRLARISRHGRQVAPGSVRTECLHLAAFFARAVGRRNRLRENPWRLVNPTEKVKLPERSIRRRKLEPEEQVSFLAALRALVTRKYSGEELERVAKVILGSGLRRYEVLYLTPADVHHGAIYVPKNIAKKRKARTVPVTAPILALLEAQRTLRKLPERSTQRYFTLHENYLDNVFMRASAKADLESPITPHDLRRTYASRMAFLVMPKVLQLLLGHANIKTTMEHYVDVNEAKLAAVVEAAGDPSDVARVQKLLQGAQDTAI